MRARATLLMAALAIGLVLAAGPARAADSSRVDAATRQVEGGAKKIGQGKVGEGVEETAKGIGNTIVEGAKFTGEKFQEAGEAAEPSARRTWHQVKDGARSFGQSVKHFFSTLFD